MEFGFLEFETMALVEIGRKIKKKKKKKVLRIKPATFSIRNETKILYNRVRKDCFVLGKDIRESEKNIEIGIGSWI